MIIGTQILLDDSRLAGVRLAGLVQMILWSGPIVWLLVSLWQAVSFKEQFIATAVLLLRSHVDPAQAEYRLASFMSLQKR